MRNHKLLGCLVLGSLLLTTVAFATELSIVDVSAIGSGCPTGTVDTLVMDTNHDGRDEFFQVSYAEFVAERPGTASKNCQITLQVNVPRGFQFSVLAVESAGYADVHAYHNGVVRTTYEFPMTGLPSRVTQGTISGPYAGDFKKADQYAVPTWSPCNQNFPLNINNRISLQKKPSVSSETGAYSLIQVDRTSGLFTQLFSIQWRSCY